MSSFFLKGKSRKITRDKSKKKKPKLINVPTENGRESSDSELEFKKFSNGEDSESDNETAEQKKLRLAKTYLDEIEKEEARREEIKTIDEDAIGKRLQKDYLQQSGKLHISLAQKLIEPVKSECKLVRVREHRLSLTCVCVSNDVQFIFTSSKCSSIIKWSIKEKKKVGSITFKSFKSLKSNVSAIAVTTDTKFLAGSDESSAIYIWDASNLKHLHTFKGHKDIVTGLVFRKHSHELYSSSKDRSVKIWSLDEMAYVETLFGHQSAINSIDASSRERAVTAGTRDSTARIWKITEESQLIFNGPIGSLDEVRLLDEQHFISGSDNGSLCLWSVLKKKPLCTVLEAHGTDNGLPRWITSIATIFNSDIFASGSYDNHIRIWSVCDAYRQISPLYSIEINGFVNCMQFTSDHKQLYAAVGQEHRSGRWLKLASAKNGMFVINLSFK